MKVNKIKLLQILISIWMLTVNVFVFPVMAQTEQQEKKQNTEDAKSGYFTVWVCSSQDMIKAEFEKGLYSESGQPVSVVEVDLKEKGIWYRTYIYRTYIGRFSSEQEASQFGNYLQNTLNIDWFKVSS